MHPLRSRTLLKRFARAQSGISMVEFALGLPVFMGIFLSGIEISNYVTTKMRVSQLALHLADHIARLGTGDQQSTKSFSETDINDVLTGAGIQAGKLNLYTNGRVIVSSLEADPSNTGKYKITWQRCQGTNTHASSYGNASANNLTGIGPAGQQVTATTGGQTIFVEVYYVYRPLIKTRYAPGTTFTEIASMPVRDTRSSTPTNTENATVHNCSAFTAT